MIELFMELAVLYLISLVLVWMSMVVSMRYLLGIVDLKFCTLLTVSACTLSLIPSIGWIFSVIAIVFSFWKFKRVGVSRAIAMAVVVNLFSLAGMFLLNLFTVLIFTN